MEMKKTSPEDVARAIIEGVERGQDDIAPDAASREFMSIWSRDPKRLEQQFASMTP
jgi:hypothetical protein